MRPTAFPKKAGIHKADIHKIIKAFLILISVLILGISIGYLNRHVFSENAKFEKFTSEIFQKEVSASTLTLHYSLADPKAYGISVDTPSLGTVQADPEQTLALCRQYITRLKEFSYSRLSRENQITLDTMLLYFCTQLKLEDTWLLEEVLSPSLGIQAQLPVLLAEYAFYTEQDIADYLKLLESIGPYFDSILAFERQKSEAGYFMSDAALDRILDQCRSFIQNPDSNYMLEIFSDKLSSYGKFTEAEQQTLCARHAQILKKTVIPAYQTLMDGLEALRGTGKNNGGLAGYPGGKDYYLYLIQTQTGTYQSVSAIENRLLRQLKEDIRQIRLMLKEQSSLITRLNTMQFPQMEPEAALSFLKQAMSQDFPPLSETTWEIRYVHESMEPYLSPAFYLTPPFDNPNSNVIYINQASQNTALSLFTTLAHEGFPGHLYQTVYFSGQNASPIRYLFSCGGYVEGWATYVESYAYDYAAQLLDDEAAVDMMHLSALNRSVNLCICSLLDIGIHYRGWNLSQCTAFLAGFGITNTASVQEIYQYITETPANYLKYYLGYLNFMDLCTTQKTTLGDAFDLKEFHRQILEIGPAPFPVVKKYLNGTSNS